MDYLLGRNPLAFSYVSGYGTHALRNPHHRAWAHQKDPKLPEAPPGAVSGGPNSTLQDPYIRKLGMSGCPPETCYVDHIESYSTNEVAINWNATLAWMAAFLDDIGHKKGRRKAPDEITGLRRGVRYSPLLRPCTGAHHHPFPSSGRHRRRTMTHRSRRR